MIRSLRPIAYCLLPIAFFGFMQKRSNVPVAPSLPQSGLFFTLPQLPRPAPAVPLGERVGPIADAFFDAKDRAKLDPNAKP